MARVIILFFHQSNIVFLDLTCIFFQSMKFVYLSVQTQSITRWAHFHFFLFWILHNQRWVNSFSLYCYHLPLEKGILLHLNKHESTSPTDAFWSSFIEIGTVVLQKMFLNFINEFTLYFLFISPFGKSCNPFEQTWITFARECFVISLVEIDWRKRWWNLKKLTDLQTNGRLTKEDQKSSIELQLMLLGKKKK